jgi:hypothetical protein
MIKPRRKWTGHVAQMGEKRNAYRSLVGKPEGKRPLRRPRHRWEDYMKIYLREVGFGWSIYCTNQGIYVCILHWHVNTRHMLKTE